MLVHIRKTSGTEFPLTVISQNSDVGLFIRCALEIKLVRTVQPTGISQPPCVDGILRGDFLSLVSRVYEPTASLYI